MEEEMATTLVFLLGKFHGQKSLTGYSPWGRKESMTEHIKNLQHHFHKGVSGWARP